MSAISFRLQTVASSSQTPVYGNTHDEYIYIYIYNIYIYIYVYTYIYIYVYPFPRDFIFCVDLHRTCRVASRRAAPRRAASRPAMPCILYIYTYIYTTTTTTTNDHINHKLTLIIIMPCHIMPRHVISCHVMSCHATSCHAMPCHVTCVVWSGVVNHHAFATGFPIICRQGYLGCRLSASR